MAIESDPYLCLGLMPGSSPAEIKRRYRQLAKQYHPDSHGQNAVYAKKLRDLNAAYAFLSDPANRSAYESRFSSVFNPALAPQPVPSAGRRWNNRCWNRSPWATACLAVLMLVSTGAGVLVAGAKVGPSLTGLFPQMSGVASSHTEAPAPDFSFMPPHSTFGNQDTASDWSRNTQH